MALYQVSPGDRILAADILQFYNILKGVTGSGEAVTFIYNAAGALILQPSSNPAAGTELFQVKNAAGTVQGAVSSDGKFYAAAGDAATPGITFEADKDTGIYRTGANTLAVAAGGVLVSALAIATATTAGFLPTPPNNTTTFLRGDATFAAVTAGTTIVVNSVEITGDVSSTSTTYVVITGLTQSVNTAATNNCKYTAYLYVINNAAIGGRCTMRIQDTTSTVQIQAASQTSIGTNYPTSVTIGPRFKTQATGAKTIRVEWKSDTGQMTVYNSQESAVASLIVEEYK